MTKIKLCGLSRTCDIAAANELGPDYIGFVFAKGSKRYIPPDRAEKLKALLAENIKAVGIFVDETPEAVADLLNSGVIDMAQLHGDEDETYIRRLRQLTGRPIIRAFRIKEAADIEKAKKSSADHVLLDSSAGTGTLFDWQLIQNMKRPYFLAGGLTPENVAEAVTRCHPFAVDVSSAIETDGVKDMAKMAAFVAAVRREKNK